MDIFAQRQHVRVARSTLKAIDQEQSIAAVHHWTVWSSICGPYTATADVLKVISRSTFDLKSVLQTLDRLANRFRIGTSHCDEDHDASMR